MTKLIMAMKGVVMFEVLVATVVMRDDKVLMVSEKKEKVKGLLNFPAGHLEPTESLFEGARGEAKEETGVDVSIDRLVDTQYFSRGEKHFYRIHFPRGNSANGGGHTRT